MTGMTGPFMDGYIIDGEYILVDVARRFQDMIKKAPLVEYSEDIKMAVMCYKEDDLVVMCSSFDVHPGRQTILSVKTNKECLLEIFKPEC